MVFISLNGSKHFKSGINKLAISLLKYIIDSLHVNNIVKLVLLIRIVYNKCCNSIIFNIILSLLICLLKRRHSLAVPVYFSGED